VRAYHLVLLILIHLACAPPCGTQLPTSQYRQGLVVIMGQCDADNAQQKFRFDPFNYHISPADNAEWCLDFDFDDKKYRPLTLFKCGQTFSDFTDDNHQRWLWPNYVKASTHTRQEQPAQAGAPTSRETRVVGAVPVCFVPPPPS